MASFFQSDATANVQSLQEFDIQVTKLLKTKFEAEKNVQIAKAEKDQLSVQISEVSSNVSKLSDNDAVRKKEIEEMKQKLEKAEKEFQELKDISEKILTEYNNAKEIQETAKKENGILQSQIEHYQKLCEKFGAVINKSDSEIPTTHKALNMNTNCAVQIIEHLSEGRFQLNQEAVKQIYNTNNKTKNLPLVLLCIAGAARKGKSFLLNFFLDNLKHQECNPDKPWKMQDDLNGFKFQSGEDRTTLGIWAWNRVFVIKQKNGSEIAVSLIDSQGVFDNKTSFADCSTIFASTCLFSSIMCFNVFNDLQEDTINNLASFIEHGKKVNDNLGGSGKLFQELVFIIRDFQYANYIKEKDGGEKYIEKRLGHNDIEELQKARNILNESYEKRKCFVFPRPGDKVMDETASQLSDVDERFVEKVQTMVNTLTSNLGNHVKKIGSTVIKCGDMQEYMTNCVQTFADNEQFAPRAVQIVNRNYMISLEEKRATEDYEMQMDMVFKKYPSGCDEIIFKTLSEACFAKVESDFTKRIHDSDILKTLTTKFDENCQKLLIKYLEKNQTLLEQEREKRRHEEELKVEAEKREQEKREAETRMQRIKKEEELKREIMKNAEEARIMILKIEENEKIAKMQQEEEKKIKKLKEESEAKEKTRIAEEQARIQKMKKEEEEKIKKMKTEEEERIRKMKEEEEKRVEKIKAEAKEKEKQILKERAIEEAKRAAEENARIQKIKEKAEADIAKAKAEEDAREMKRASERQEEERKKLAEVEAELKRIKAEAATNEKKRLAQEAEHEKQRKADAAIRQAKEAEETIKNEFERFKRDMAARLRKEFGGMNTSVTYRTTINGWHCCILYNQGLTYTDVKVFYRKNGETIYEISESFLWAYKANRVEGLLQESLQHTEDIPGTFRNAVNKAS